MREGTALVFLILSYLCGSMPFGYWFAKIVKGKNFDIRDHGSHNIGFTNVKRVLGWKIAIPVLVFDMVKGFFPAILGQYFFGDGCGALCHIASAMGHSYSFYFYCTEGVFAGGKSVATLFGGILALEPKVALVALVVWGIVLLATKYMSLASMLGAISTVFASFYFGLGIFWNCIFIFAAFIIVIRHIRNITRLIQGIEPKFNEKRGGENLEDEATIAFLIHPKDIGDMAQSKVTSWILKLLAKKIISKNTVRFMISHAKILECGEVNNIETLDDRKARVLLLTNPLLPDQIKDEKNKALIEGLLKSAAVQAQRRGARVLGLGGLNSTVCSGGKLINDWVRDRGLTIQIDNGAAFTAAATIEAAENALKGKPLSELNVAIIGARGLIASAIGSYFKGKVKSIVSVVRSKRYDSVTIDLDNVLTIDELSGIKEADLIISCTSSPEAIFTLENQNVIKQGAIVLDVAFPSDFDAAILEKRPDITLIRCGLVAMPGEYFKSDIDFHFGSIEEAGREKLLVPACLAQSVILGLTKCYKHASLSSRITVEDIDFFRTTAKKYGFSVITSAKSEPEIYTGNMEVYA